MITEPIECREMEYIKQALFTEICWSLASLAHLINITIFLYFKSTQHL